MSTQGSSSLLLLFCALVGAYTQVASSPLQLDPFLPNSNSSFVVSLPRIGALTLSSHPQLPELVAAFSRPSSVHSIVLILTASSSPLGASVSSVSFPQRAASPVTSSLPLPPMPASPSAQ